MSFSWCPPNKVAISICFATVASTVAFCKWSTQKHKRELERLQNEWSQKRQEERTGRIRAEVKLRATLKELQIAESNTAVTKSENKQDKKTMVLRCIGTIVSPYSKRMGTPRQPQLVPASRGYVQIIGPPEALFGIEQYSHVWIIFEFHANTDTTLNFKTKIRPPRGKGVKVGQLATRSPHRPNPLGLSLIKIEHWDAKNRRLYVSGLDIVHGSPVYDIKPVVPWDIPGYPVTNTHLKVPDWVEQDDEIACVEFLDVALQQLQTAVSKGQLAPLYTDENDGYHASKTTIQQILAQDPRSSHKGLKENARGSTSGTYSFIFCDVQVTFATSKDGVLVKEIIPVQFDASNYIDGIPLIMATN
jgi:tRNA-Thr(GGU) m(6)t(6)A37 methyltransferase TsaA